MKFTRKLLIVVLVIGSIRILLPIIALNSINYVLSHKIEDYHGQLDDLELSIIRGQITLINLHIEKREKPQAIQFDMAKALFDFSWKELWNKNIVAEIYLDNVFVAISEIPKIKPPKSGELKFSQIRKMLAESRWSSEISLLSVRNANVNFIIPKAKGPPLSLENISVDISNVHMSPAKKWQLANIKVDSYLQGQGHMQLIGTAQPLAIPAKADMNFSMVDFDLKTLNGLLLKILPLDLTKGKFSAYIEATTEDGFSNGYTKLFFDDIDVVSNPQKLKSGRHFLIEAGVAIGNWILKNNKEKSMALNLPFKMKNDDVVVNTADAFWSTIENKRNALDRRLDNSVSFAQNRNEKQLE